MNTYTIHDATCKFCGTAVSLRIHNDCPPTKIEVWKPNAACNRCADARRTMYEFRDKITKLAGVWSANKANATSELESKVRLAFTMLTKSFCQACCTAFLRPNEWKASLLPDLMQRPQNAYAILKDYESSFKPLVTISEPVPDPAPAVTLPGMEFATPDPF